MQFKLLGPLEVINKGQSLPLNGNNQRATLGFLLLHANSVVATSQLLKALWPVDMPMTGRKMLQNAVSGLRGIFSIGENGSDSALLLTHAPGYLLRVETDRVDLSRFNNLANSGRADLAAGSWEGAAQTLRDALALWRGPVLADLVESGVSWPELTAVRNSRWVVVEDYVEAEFASGHYSEVISELETWVEIEPLRERLCGQLMRALYHCGRQADALGLYRRTRTRLIEELGLDPGRELRELERLILNQDLEQPSDPFRLVPSADVSQPHRAVELGPRKPARQPEVHDAVLVQPGARRQTGYAAAELKWVSVALVRTRFDHDVGDVDPEDVDAVFRDITATVHEEVERFSGTIEGTVGSVWLAVFGASRNREDDAVRAVRAAMSVRERLRSRGLLSSPRVAPLAVMVAVATGNALVRAQEDDRDGTPMVTGGMLDRCMGLLAHASANEILVCEATRRASEFAIAYDEAHDPAKGVRAVNFFPEREQFEHTLPLVGRDRELKMLLDLFAQVSRQSRTHLATVLGEPGIGKTRLIVEFEHAITDTPGKARCLISRIPYCEHNGTLATLFESAKSYARICGGDSAKMEAGKLTDVVRGLAGVGDGSSWMLSHLKELSASKNDAEKRGLQRESFAAWRQFLDEASSGGPLVVVIEGLHRADDILLNFVDHITEQAVSFPLLVIVTARPELLDRRPAWSGGKVRASTTMLGPLSDDDASRLFTLAYAGNNKSFDQCRGASDTGITEALRAVASRVGGNPLFTIEYARMLREDDVAAVRDPHLADELLGTGLMEASLPLPQLVSRVLAARLDTLPAEVKAVLLDAAVLGEHICEAGLVAVGGHTADQASFCLEYLVRWEFLRKMSRQPDATVVAYAFQHIWIRDVAYRMIPRKMRADKHRRSAAWLEMAPGRNVNLLAYHQRQATVLSVSADGSAVPT